MQVEGVWVKGTGGVLGCEGQEERRRGEYHDQKPRYLLPEQMGTERWVGNVERMDGIRNVNKVLVEKSEQNKLSGRLTGSAKVELEGMWRDSVD